MIIVNIKKLHKDAIIPKYAHKGDACVDLHAIENTKVWPKDIELIATGIAIELPEGYEAQIRPRSGLAAKNFVTIFNTPGTIDSGYRGEIKVLLFNFNIDPFLIKKGDRIAQMVIAPVSQVVFCEIGHDMEQTTRGVGGFGSTGREEIKENK